MAIKKIVMRPEGDNNYADELHPKTSADSVLMSDDKTVEQSINEHKAEMAAEENLGHIKAKTDTEGNLLLPETIWKKIDTITIAQTTAELSLDVSSAYTEFRIIGKNIKGDYLNSSTLRIVFNNSFIPSEYMSLFVRGTGVDNESKNYISLWQGSVSITHASQFDIHIIDNPNCSTLVTFSTRNTDTIGGAFGNSIWKPIEKVNNIRINASNGNIAIGSEFEIWGR